jgi:hypothetical protein
VQPRHGGQEIDHLGRLARLDLLSIDHGDGGPGFLQRDGGLGRGDDDGLEADRLVGSAGLLRRQARGCEQ